MPFHNEVPKLSVKTLNHCDVFNEINVKLLQNTLYNKKLLEDLYSLYELQQQTLQSINENVDKLNNILEKNNIK